MVRHLLWVFALVVALAGKIKALEEPITAPAKTNATNAQVVPTEAIVLPDLVPDPIEPMNRAMWAVNKGIMKGVISPTGKAYRFLVFRQIRSGLANFGRNLKYPGRLLNNLLQGNFIGARDETSRFCWNTFIGLGGFIDMASRMNVPRSETDFGMTLAHWGWKPGCYLMLPIFGPSNERDGVGAIGDALASPLTYFSPYSYIPYGIQYNNLTDDVEPYLRMATTDEDPYFKIRYLSTFSRQARKPDFTVEGAKDQAALETLQITAFALKDPEFPERGRTCSVKLSKTGKLLRYNLWMQPHSAPVVYIVPGLGSHRQAQTVLALAELVFHDGFNVVSISNPYNYEFMEAASTSALPGYTPWDSRDIHNALTEIDARLRQRYPGRLGKKVLMGYSMGAFEAMHIAADEQSTTSPSLCFDRYIGINPPVRLLYGIKKLDAFFQAPLAWPAGERTNRIENTFLKVAALAKKQTSIPDGLPFNAIESQYLIGLSFRFTLLDVIYDSQQRTNMGILKQPLKKSRRDAVYREIFQYSFGDYLEKLAKPYFHSRGVDMNDPDTLEAATDMRRNASTLRSNSKIRLITNRNDFLLSGSDVEWLERTFDSERLFLFNQGGHVGNLSQPQVQKAILHALEGLKENTGRLKR